MGSVIGDLIEGRTVGKHLVPRLLQYVCVCKKKRAIKICEKREVDEMLEFLGQKTNQTSLYQVDNDINRIRIHFTSVILSSSVVKY